ncbi:hydroxymethylglutaryl-CoA synthase family protein [Amycolatopsis magusensis]|uniref:hydroxymethylglutaryl-CoA synthase family protein n=1 Tax=Amycolatopsis magusensis TaxID=882444 RepID=UPI003C30DA69
MNHRSATSPRGIEDLNLYCGLAQIPARVLFERRGLDSRRFGNLMMTARSVQLPWEDPVTNAVNAARPVVEVLGQDARDRIELLVVSTESGVDHSKSVASYVHRQLELSPHCRTLEVKQACYGATGMLQLAAAQLTGPDRKALVIATDVNPMDEHARYAEPTTGHGAAAILVGDPVLLALDEGAYGLYSFETMDTARPRPDLDLYHADRSLLAYLECLSGSYRHYASRVDSADFGRSFDHLVLHSPFGGMVKAAHRKLMRELCRAGPAAIAEDFARRVAGSLTYVTRVGNMFSGSLYLALAGLIDSTPAAAEDGARVGFFAYGSGCASEFFSGVLRPAAAEILAGHRISARLDARRVLSFEQYEELVPVNRACLVPTPRRELDLSGVAEFAAAAEGPQLALKSIEDYHRKYEWW